MTQQEIIEGNKLLAEFMGFINPYSNAYQCCFNKINTTCAPYHMLFHSSFDWLMPVVKKCSESFEHHQYNSEEYYHITEEIFHPDYSLSEFMDADIEAIYSRVVTYIKWYNQNKREMKSQFVSYEIALALKELGCNDFKMFGWYINEDDSEFGKSLHTIDDRMFYFNVMYCFKAPLWQQVIDWFREKHHLHITITSISQESWQWHIQFPHDSLDVYWREDFYSYEEARESAILEAIKLLKGEKK